LKYFFQIYELAKDILNEFMKTVQINFPYL